MSIDELAADWSTTLIYSAMLVYTLSFLAFAVDLSSRGRARGKTEEPEPSLVAVASLGPVEGGAGARDAVERPRTDDGIARRGDRGTQGRSAGGWDRGDDLAVMGSGGGRTKAGGMAVSLTWLAFALHLAGVAARGWSVRRMPWGNMYEFATAGAVVVTGTFLFLLLRRDLRYLGTFVVGPVLLTLGLSVTVLYTEAGQLVPALKSGWPAIHVSVAFIASALLTLGFSATVLQLAQSRREARRSSGRQLPGGRFMDGLPSSRELAQTAYRLHAVAFPLWTFAVMAGAVWAEAAWGRYWNWDPKEVWSFIIWVVYAGYLHARATRGWDRQRAAYFAIAGYVCVLINFGLVNVFAVGMHSYGGIS